MKKTKLTRNFTLKIMSVFIGFLIWFIVVNVDNPVSSKSITIAGENVEEREDFFPGLLRPI